MKKAFTLAEVLITLAIIGVVAALTIPTLVKNYQKQATVTKLQKAYTVLFQAVKLSEIDNGDVSGWDFGTKNNSTATLNWFKTYLAPYMKYTNVKVDDDPDYSEWADVFLQDGTLVKFWNNDGNQVHAFVFLNGTKSQIGGKDSFFFFIGGAPTTTNVKEIRPYDGGLTSVSSRTDWINTSTNSNVNGCQKTATNSAKPYCAGLIMYDGWQIKDDYPYFN